jgi:5-oxoprolinase (ATP-hydrolysing)
MLCEFSSSRGLAEVGTVTAEDQLDDGSTIKLAITIDRCRINTPRDMGDGMQGVGGGGGVPACRLAKFLHRTPAGSWMEAV